ncbi:Na(+)-translocating NADH-quinone reductase subunit A [Aeoliella mucimassa]|uniref:Na(+)-translocating NADH-quinone reductase subunit A n=1 Tax=Aeoliella mucimassa TaxID=2527972 RepID=A0A518AMZ4_9BACT|nr:Na(+)-translocating NADH-quinone reductase subunit A [Aeoliella mucimassa]QDU56094.1 Na(+)-translocating NADH-quinone reductase subunit A [Aeoliella mucimassa]
MPQPIRITKGLDIPLAGEPKQQISDAVPATRVALLGDDYIGMKPTMLVAEGDTVKRGQVLFTDKKLPAVCYTAPAAGRVVAVSRGAKRKFLSVTIEIDGDESVDFKSYTDSNLTQLPAVEVREQLIASGLWTALRTRPFSKVPDPETSPYALFVTAIDTNPLAADPKIVISTREREFKAGLEALSTLTEGKTYLCKADGVSLPGDDLDCVESASFAGPHPAGLPGTHIHFLAPVNLERHAWYIGYQDVIAVGHLFLTGQLSNERVVALAGPAAKDPRLVRTQLGANMTDLTAGETTDAEYGVRVISGSVLAGRKSVEPVDFLGRYDNAITLIAEGKQRELMGWSGPGFNKFSIKPIFASVLSAGRRFAMTTSTEGSERAIVPLGSFEQVMPLDIIATPLLKSLVVDDTEQAQALGCLELDEEDLALCSFVDTGKHDFGPILRRNLTTIEQEG